MLLELEPRQLARLWKALLLLRDTGVTPPQPLLQVSAATVPQTIARACLCCCWRQWFS